jgi:putative oxidoreductase
LGDALVKEAKVARTILGWISRLAAAVILPRTLFFKFIAAPESVHIFTKIGAEPWGRIGSGVVEPIAAIPPLTPSYARLGSVPALGMMARAIASRLTVLGTELQGEGLLFGLALTVFVASAINRFPHRAVTPVPGRRLA